MKIQGFILFLIIVLSLYFLINFYIFIKGFHALPSAGSQRTVFAAVFLFLVLAYPATRFLEHFLSDTVITFLLQIGAYYLAAMVFAFFLVLAVDLAHLLFHFLPVTLKHNPAVFVYIRSHGCVLIIGTVILLSLVGAINARLPRVQHLELKLTKPFINPGKLRLVMASDIHLGTLIHNSRLNQYVNLINEQQPDFILLVGDVFDEDISSLIEQNTAALLRKLKSRYGVYAVPGNHEYFSGIAKAITYLQEAGITVLRDSVALVAGQVYLVGRDDITGNRFGKKRKTLAALLEAVERNKPIILMDHQPFHLSEAEQNRVDLQLSGHTHHGQIFPFNLITSRIYEVSWGYKKKGNTHIYVSCGLGTWGPPVRLGNRPEIVVIDLLSRE